MPKITGHLFNDNDNNGVLNTGDTSTGKRTVRLQDKNGKEIAKTLSDDGSNYQFIDVAPGEYRVTRDFPKGYRLSGPHKRSFLPVTVPVDGDTACNLGTTNLPPVIVAGSPNNAGSPNTSYEQPGTITKSVVGMSVHKPTDIIYSQSGNLMAALFWSQCNTRHTREWHTCYGQVDKKLTKAKFDPIRAWKKAGFGVTLCVTPNAEMKVKPTANQSKDAIEQVLDLAGDCVDSWEILNEPNGEYWFGNDPVEAVDLYCNPMYEILHAAGKEVIGASVTYDVKFLKRMYDAGLLADVIGFHAYQLTAKGFHELMLSLEAAVPGQRRIDLTEYNAFVGGNVRAGTDPTHKGAKFPVRTPQEAVTIQNDTWKMLPYHPRVRRPSYFIVNKKLNDSATSPLMLIDNNRKATIYYENHWKSVA